MTAQEPTRAPARPIRAKGRKTRPGRLDPRVRAAVMARDRECVARKLARLGKARASECRDQWGLPQLAAEPLTFGHVRWAPGAVQRDDERFAVAECAGHNAEHWESANAGAVNAYLDGLYPGRLAGLR